MEPKQHQTASRRNGESGGRKSMGLVSISRTQGLRMEGHIHAWHVLVGQIQKGQRDRDRSLGYWTPTGLHGDQCLNLPPGAEAIIAATTALSQLRQRLVFKRSDRNVSPQTNHQPNGF